MNHAQFNLSAATSGQSQPGMQALTQQEIGAVAGGPEATVGTGINPTSQAVPGMRMLSAAEIDAVAGGPEGEVSNGVTPPR